MAADWCVLFIRAIHQGSQKFYLPGKRVLRCPLSLEDGYDGAQELPLVVKYRDVLDQKFLDGDWPAHWDSGHF